MPSILFINQHYWPDVASTGQHLTDLAEHLAQDEFDVEVLCATGAYLADRIDLPKTENRNGVSIRRAKTTSFGRGSNLGRIVDYASFYAKVMLRLAVGRKYDLIVVLTTPPLLGFASATVGKLRRRRYAIWSMDLHPDAEEALGMLGAGKLLTRFLHSLNGLGYRRADMVVDLGPVMKRRLLEKKVKANRLHTVPVWSDAEEVRPLSPAENPLRAELGLAEKFVVMYSGNAGLAHQFEAVLEVMLRFRDRPDIHFLFVGAGPKRKEIEDFIEREGIEHATYLDYFPRNQLAQSLSVGDVHLLTLRNEMGGIAAPGKLYGIMAAGRPVVVVGPRESEPALTVAEEEVGLVIDTTSSSMEGAADVLEKSLLRLQAGQDERLEMGTRAREIFLSQFERSVVCDTWSQLLTRELGKAGQQNTPS